MNDIDDVDEEISHKDMFFYVEIEEIQNFTHMDVEKLTNSEAKTTFLKLLSFPLQSICR